MFTLMPILRYNLFHGTETDDRFAFNQKVIDQEKKPSIFVLILFNRRNLYNQF